MPGIFGGYGCRSELYETLRSHIEDIWGECKSLSLPNVSLGGHAFSVTHLHCTLRQMDYILPWMVRGRSIGMHIDLHRRVNLRFSIPRQ